MAFIPASNSVVAFQSDPTKLVGTVSVVGLNFGNSSVIVQGSVTAIQGTNPWQINQPSPSIIAYQAAGSILAVSGTFSSTPQGSITALQPAGSILAVNMPSPSIIAYQAAGSILAVSGSFTANPQSSIIAIQAAGSVLQVRTDNASVVAILSNSSVTALQGTNPWLVNVPTPSYISYQLAGSVMAVNTTVTTGNSSVQLLAGVAAIGSVAVLQGTNPWVINMPSPSVIAYQLAGSILATSATVNTGNSSVQLLGGVAVIGSVATLQGTNPWLIGNSSVQIVGPSSNNSVITVIQGSVAAVINNSSVWALQGTAPWVIQSIVGTYAEDVASGANDKGLLILGVRNDTVASLVNADLDYTVHSFDSAGRILTKPFAANEASIYAHASVVNGGDSGSVLVVAAAGAGLRNYITDWNVSNTGSVNTLITFTEGGGSIIGRTIAPAGGGSNMPGMNSPMRNNLANQPINMVTTTASSVVYVAVYGHKAP